MGLGAVCPNPHRAESLIACCQILEQLNIPFLPLTPANPLENFQHPLGSDPAGRTFSARLILTEIHKVAGHIHHAGVIIHNDHSS